MKCGIFGGAFNPFHNGHLHLVNSFIDKLGLERVILIPTHIPPHKASGELVSGQHRINMLRTAFEGDSRFEVSDIEFRRNGSSYTFDTLSELRTEYPDDELYLIIGSDQYLSFDTWYKAREIARSVTVCSAARHNDELEMMLRFRAENGFMQSSIVAHFDVVELSSTEIRNRVKNGISITGLVPPAVEKYIRDNNLYV